MCNKVEITHTPRFADMTGVISFAGTKEDYYEICNIGAIVDSARAVLASEQVADVVPIDKNKEKAND